MIDEPKDLVEVTSVEALKSNSNKSRVKTNPSKKVKNVTEKEIKRVVKHQVTTRKQPVSKRLGKTLFNESAGNVGQYILADVIFPSLKETISEVVKGAIDMLLFGESRRSSSKKSPSHVSYTSFSQPRRNEPSRREPRYNARAVGDFRDTVFADRQDAEEVLFALFELIDAYGEASVADLCELSGEIPKHTDHKYGWDDIGGSRVVKSRGGYIIDLPVPDVLVER